jgi:hypothetical protein
MGSKALATGEVNVQPETLRGMSLTALDGTYSQ